MASVLREPLSRSIRILSFSFSYLKVLLSSSSLFSIWLKNEGLWYDEDCIACITENVLYDGAMEHCVLDPHHFSSIVVTK